MKRKEDVEAVLERFTREETGSESVDERIRWILDGSGQGARAR